MLNKLLSRQIQKHFGNPENIPENFSALLKVISESYDQCEKDRNTLEHSINLSSSEMTELSNKLKQEKEEVIKSHDELKTLFENTREVFFSVQISFENGNPNYNLLQMSPACFQVYGYSEEYFFANPTFWRDVILEEDKAVVKAGFPRLLKGESLVDEYRIRHKDGSVRWITTRITPTLSASGQLIRIDGVSSDINEKKLSEQKLETAHKELNRILENVNEVIFSMNMVTHQYVYISAACTKVYGYSVNEFIASPMLWKEVIHPEDTDMIDPFDERLFRGEETHYQFRIIHRNKSIRWLESKVQPTLNEAGQLIALDIIVNDITDTIEAQQKLEEANNELKKLFNNINEVMYSVDMVSYKLIQMSTACEKVYGYTSEEFLSQRDLWRKVIHPEDLHISFSQQDILNAGKQVLNQYRIIHKSGGIRWIENIIIPSLDETGRLIRLDGLTKDITEKIISAQKLQESEVRFRSLIENSADMLTMVDELGTVLYESPAVARTLGYAVEENIGHSGFALIHPDDQQKAMEVFDAIMENPGKPVHLSVRMKTKNGDYIYAEGNITNLLRLQGINAIVSNFRDVTTRVEAEHDLNESQKRYRLVYENPFLGIALGTINGTMQNVNDAYCNMLGYSPEELAGMHFSQFTPTEDYELELPFIQKMAKGEIENYQLEKRYITKAGKVIWAELSVSCAKDETGQIQFVIAVIQNITSRKKAEASLQKSEANLRNIFENTDTAYVLLNENANILSYNKLAQELAKEEMIETLAEGKNYLDLMLEGRRKEVSATIKNVLKKRQRVSYEVKYQKPNQPERWLSVSMHPIFDHNKKVLGLSVAATDITSRKNTEQLIKSSNERYELVIKATNDVIWDWNIPKNRIFRSENYKQIFGYIGTGDNIYSRSIHTHIHPDDKERILKSIGEKINDSNSILWEDEYRYYRSNGEMAYVQDRGYIIYDENKKPIRMVGAMRDITKEKLFALERDKIASDLIRQNKDLEQFAYIVSHNLRAPLANIIGLSRIIQTEKYQSPAYQMGLGGLDSSVKKLDNVITDLGQILQVKREISEKKEVVQFSQLVTDIKTSISDFIKKEEVDIRTDFSAVDEIFTLKSYMHSIFYNLISNSIKYSRPGEKPVIEIKAWSTDSRIFLSFRDNGRGIDLAANGAKVFGLYKRFHYHVEGKGMGLFMVKTQIETLGGKINIESSVNKGTEFLIEFEKQSLPVAEEQLSAHYQ